MLKITILFVCLFLLVFLRMDFLPEFEYYECNIVFCRCLMVKMKDVADRAGVSVATVSNVFTGKHYVSPEVKDRVLKAVEELNYHINLNARGLKSSKTKTLGVVLPDITKQFFNGVLRGVLDSAEHHGYRVIVLSSYFDYSVERECINSLRGSNVDGIILDSGCDWHNSDSWANELVSYEGRYTPIVSIENILDDSLISSVTIDVYYWSSKITEYLISKGKRRILYLSGPLHLKHERDRFSGYKQALKDNGLKLNDKLLITGDFSASSAYDALNSLLQSKTLKFDAIQASNDEAALGALKALKEHGVRVPEDIMLCGFDNLFAASLVEPGITTINVPRYDIGYEAANECIRHIEEPSLPPRNIVLSSQIIKRASTEVGVDSSWDIFEL